MSNTTSEKQSQPSSTASSKKTNNLSLAMATSLDTSRKESTDLKGKDPQKSQDEGPSKEALSTKGFVTKLTPTPTYSTQG